MDIPLRDLIIYPLPEFLEGRCTHTLYVKWLNKKAENLFIRDKKRGKPYAKNATKQMYKKEIHKAVLESGDNDPYTGEPLAWELICTWKPDDQPDGYKKQFDHMPTVDHVVGDALEFEICSFQANDAKSDMTPGEFIQFCKKVAAYR
jgi:hypothetical protein